MADKYLYEPDPLPSPIAAEGNYVVIPNTQAVPGDGKASIALGFGPENSKTIDEGGRAVRRQDLNGLFNRLSQILYWVQSGGQFTYKTNINYAPNCMVIYNNQFYVCRTANGPSNAIITPGRDEAYWLPLSKFGDFISTSSSSVTGLSFDTLTVKTDGLNTNYQLSGSTQSSISASGGKGYFSMSTFNTSRGLSAGSYSLKNVLQSLVSMSHTHSSTSVSGDGSTIYCTYCSYCSYCHCNCDCNCDCGDDTPY